MKPPTTNPIETHLIRSPLTLRPSVRYVIHRSTGRLWCLVSGLRVEHALLDGDAIHFDKETLLTSIIFFRVVALAHSHCSDDGCTGIIADCYRSTS
jgi:hypothetical protein